MPPSTLSIDVEPSPAPMQAISPDSVIWNRKVENVYYNTFGIVNGR